MKKRLNVWFINHYAEPPEGMATRPFEIARRLGELEYDVTIFASNFGHYTLRPLHSLGSRLWRTESLFGVTFVWLWTLPYRGNGAARVANMLSFSFVAFIAALLRRERPDIVVGVTTHPFAGLTGWLLAKITGARFFYEVTDLWPQTLVDFGRLTERSVATRVLRGIERFLYDRAERIIMLWRDTADYVRSIGADAGKIAWIPHGVELDRYKDLARYDGAARSPFTLVFLGGFNSANAIGTMIDAAEYLLRIGAVGIRLELVGAGIEKQHWMSEAERRGLRNVVFPDPVPKTRISAAMSNADAFIYGLQDVPLYRYGITLNKLQDYLASGRPIVFYGWSSYDPVREAGAGIAVHADDAVALGDAILQLTRLSPEERMTMGQNGRRWLLTHHLIPDLAKRYDDLFRHVETKREPTTKTNPSGQEIL